MYINPRGKVFAHLDRLAAWKAGETPAPVTIEWDLTNVCSRKCQACHFAHTHVAGPWATSAARPDSYASTGRIANPAVVKRGLEQMARANVKSIVWSGGGEPTLHPQCAAIIEFADQFGLQQGMYTLGGHVTPQIGQAASRLEWVVVSLDAETPGAYTAEKGVPAQAFHDVLDGIRRLVDACPVVGVSYLLDEHNYTRTDAMLALSRSLGVTYTTFRPTVRFDPLSPGQVTGDRRWLEPMGNVAERLARESDVEIDPSRFEAYGQWTSHGYETCYGIRLNAVVTPDGRMWVCPNRRGFEDSCLGDLSVEAFADIWARHPSSWQVDRQCRAMCRLHPVNETLAAVYQPRTHEAFV